VERRDVKFGGKEDSPVCDRDQNFIPVGYSGTENLYYYALQYNDMDKLVFEYEKASSADIDKIAASNPNYKKSGTNVNTSAISGGRKHNAKDIPWYNSKGKWNGDESVVKGRWIKVKVVQQGKGNGEWVYAQWLDAGPYYYDDFDYVFNNERQKNDRDVLYQVGSGSGIDLSPAVLLKMGIKKSEMGAGGINTKVDWQFVDASDKIYISDNKTYW